jgi:hypothetical protein
MPKARTRKSKQAAPAEKQTKPTGEFSKSEYNEVVRISQLSELRLVGSRFKMKPAYLDKLHGGRELDMGYSSEALFFEYNGEVSTTVFRWEAFVLPAGEMDENDVETRKKDEGLLYISCDYLVGYNIPDANKDAVKAFVERVGEFATFPYFRAMTAHYGWESGSELPTLPVLKRPRRSMSGSRERAASDSD